MRTRSILPLLLLGASSSLEAQRATYPPECTSAVVKAIATSDTMRVRCVRDRARVDLFNAQAAYTAADATRTVKATALATAVRLELAASAAYAAKFPPVTVPPVVVVPPVVTPPVVVTPPPAPAVVGDSIGLTIAARAELPRQTPSLAAPIGSRRIRVNAGANLQAAINAAQSGDVLALAPGSTFVGEYVLPARAAGWITIETDTTLPPRGVRMTPSRAAALRLAKILTPTNQAAIRTAPNARGFWLAGLEISATGGRDVYALVDFGINGPAQTAANMPTDLGIDRSYVHGSPTLDLRRCVNLNSASTVVVDSWLGECHSNQGDSQAILGLNGSGPHLIQNSTLESGHQAFMYGGGDPSIAGLVPSDITFRGNHMTRPASWKGSFPYAAGKWQTKTIAETKNARRVLLEGNLIENVWQDAQVGYAILFKSSNQDGGCTWCTSSDITFRYNRIRNVAAVFNIAARPEQYPAVPAARFTIHDNYATEVNVGAFNGPGVGIQVIGDVADLIFAHNTIDNPTGGSATMFDGGGNTRFVMHSNAMHAGRSQYGLIGTGTAVGNATWAKYALPPSAFRANLIVNAFRCDLYPAGTLCPSTFPATMPAGLDGRPVGADLSRVNAAVAGAEVAP